MAAASGALANVGLKQLSNFPQERSRQVAQNDPILHLLNRITWGATPEDLAHAREIGYNAYLEEQLNPASIEDPNGDLILRQLPLLTLSRQELYRLHNYEGRSYSAMIEGMIRRATVSSHQLQERMVDFWTDHFNVSFGDESGAAVLNYHNTAIRPHVFGNFREMLLATAKDPAMLDYLDNDVNIAEDPNENYARELMELHTLGVDGGYTERDVVEVARAFTGWTVREGTRDGFYFDEENHDTGEKIVLGHRLPAGRGIEDGLHVIDILVNHPATARFLCHKLCVRFVSDTPPSSLVDSAARVWEETRGQIRPVLRHIFTSSEFRDSIGQKFRRPLEFLIGALRATGAQFMDFWMLHDMLAQLAHIPYGWPPPNGYPDFAVAWLNSNNLLVRWNVAMTLTHTANSTGERLQTNLFNRINAPSTVSDLVAQVATVVFGTPLPTELAQPFIDYVANGADGTTPIDNQLLAQKLATLFGLMLASPAYQWR